MTTRRKFLSFIPASLAAATVAPAVAVPGGTGGSPIQNPQPDPLQTHLEDVRRDLDRPMFASWSQEEQTDAFIKALMDFKSNGRN